MSNPGAATTTTVHPQVLSSNQAIRLIAYATSVSINATGDAAITLPVINTTTYNVTNVVITNANKDVSAGALAIWTQPAFQSMPLAMRQLPCPSSTPAATTSPMLSSPMPTAT